jgi:hypothetical protein
MNTRRSVATFVLIAALLGVVAAVAPAPWYPTDRDAYERAARQLIIRDCSDLHCFRVLVPWVLGRIPGPARFIWKAYAVLMNAAAAIAIGRLTLLLGLSSRAATIAVWISALGTVPLFTLFDPFTADPLMFLAGPLLTAELIAGRRGRAGWLGAVGVLAKEFAAAPLWIFTLWNVLLRRWSAAWRGFVIAVAVTLVFVTLHLALMTAFNYSYGNSASADLLGGSFLVHWLSLLTPRTAVAVTVGELGALLLLAPAGFVRAGRELRYLALAAIPATVALSYVQQPDRALWNFHFIVVPLAALILQALPDRWCAAFIAAFALANLRIGAQLKFLPPAGFGLAASAVIAAAAIARTFGTARAATEPSPMPLNAEAPVGSMLALAFAVELAAAGVLLTLTLDRASHQRVDGARGVNTRGFRGIAPFGTPNGHRVVIVGGTAAYGPEVDWAFTSIYQLQKLIGERRRPGQPDIVADVVNLAAVGDGAASYADTLADYAPLRPEVVGIYDGYGDPQRGSSRRRSVIFRTTGYMPELPFLVAPPPPAAGEQLIWSGFDDRAGDPNQLTCERESAAYCASMIAVVEQALALDAAVVIVTPPYLSVRHRTQQRSLAGAIAARFSGRRNVRQVNLGEAVDLGDPVLSPDHVRLTTIGHHLVAEHLVDPFIAAIEQRFAPTP